MQLIQRTTSRLVLQRLVAIVSSVGALLVTVVNYYALRQLYQLGPTHALLNPSVLWIVVLAAAFATTGIWDSVFARSIQVLCFTVGGIVIALFTETGNLTSVVFIVFAMVLLNEYASQRYAAVVAIGVAVIYLITKAIAIDTRTASVLLSLLNTLILISSVIILFALISYRQYLIRREHESMLEQLVSERTAELREALEQRDTMLQEIHHRVGNSLQLLASFVSLQQDDAEEDQRRILKETELRVHAIADVHATLYSQHQLSHLPLAVYVPDLIHDMQIAYRGEADISVSVATEVEAHIDFAISFGVILNELVTNAAKHAGTAASRAKVVVALDDRSGELRLTVRDHGRGFLEEIAPGIGTEVVEQLVRQHNGTICRKSDDGAIIDVRFPLHAVVREQPVRVGAAAALDSASSVSEATAQHS